MLPVRTVCVEQGRSIDAACEGDSSFHGTGRHVTTSESTQTLFLQALNVYVFFRSLGSWLKAVPIMELTGLIFLWLLTIELEGFVYVCISK